MTLLEEQFEILKGEYPGATLRMLPSGAALIEINNFELPSGWSKSSISIRFIAPIGYPFGKPDCFWTDPDLKVQKNGSPPQNTGLNQIPEVPGQFLWFSWHLAQWNPNKDNLSTYTHVIESRLKEIR